MKKHHQGDGQASQPIQRRNTGTDLAARGCHAAIGALMCGCGALLTVAKSSNSKPRLVFIVGHHAVSSRSRSRLSNVLRPMTIIRPGVILLNHLESSGRCQGILFPAPITRFNDIAAMALKCFMLTDRHAHWRKKRNGPS